MAKKPKTFLPTLGAVLYCALCFVLVLLAVFDFARTLAAILLIICILVAVFYRGGKE